MDRDISKYNKRTFWDNDYTGRIYDYVVVPSIDTNEHEDITITITIKLKKGDNIKLEMDYDAIMKSIFGNNIKAVTFDKYKRESRTVIKCPICGEEMILQQYSSDISDIIYYCKKCKVQTLVNSFTATTNNDKYLSNFYTYKCDCNCDDNEKQ